MTLVVYDTLRREKVPFEPLAEGEVTMYVCGLTPYSDMHVGHLRTYVAYDLLRRWLEHRGYDVHHVQNITDVEDKIIDYAQEHDLDPLDLAERIHGKARDELRALRVLPAHDWPRVSENVDGIIEMTQQLLDNGHAYVGTEPEGLQDSYSVYYDVSSFEGYGKLSGADPDDLQQGVRKDVATGKRDPADFALWKAAQPDEPTWESPWGIGRPGWHIECSVMSSSILGPRFDIHGGGQDLIFPHHENEIAQTEGAHGVQPCVRHWMHTGFLTVGGEKMSKSEGNFVTAEEALDDWDPLVLRLWLMGTHYRSPIDLSEESLHQAERNLERLGNTLRHVRQVEEVARGGDPTDEDADFLGEVEDLRVAFEEAMDDDLNTPEALARMLEMASTLNRYADDDPHAATLADARGILEELGDVLAILPEDGDGPGGTDAAPFIDLLLEVREMARERKAFELADRIRDGLQEEGVVVEDTDQGPRWRMG